MNRTDFVSVAAAALLTFALPAQEPAKPAEPPVAPAQTGPLDEVVAEMRRAEQAAKSIRLELETEGEYPGGMKFSTKGVLRVLRGEHAAVHTVLEFTFEQLKGRMDSVKTAAGVQVFESNPTFGDVFYRLDPQVVADLEWAGQVLARSDLPGMADGRAEAPLGSAMVADLAAHYDLRELSKKGEGVWFGGDRKPLLGAEAEAEGPFADRVELLIRQTDKALLEVVYLQRGKPIQRIRVAKLELDAPMDPATFVVDARGQKPREARDHKPAWEQIQRVLRDAEAKSGETRPSARK